MAARDAAEKVVVDYEILPAVSDVAEALSREAPTIWPDAPNNLALDSTFGDPAAVAAAIAGAHVVIEQTIRNQRTASAFMEPRSAIGRYDEAEGQYILISGCQGVHRVRHPLAGCLKVPQERVRVICPDVGGGFGSRTNLYPEQVAVVWAARRVGRAVKWTGDRHEAFLTDYTARDVVTAARLAFDRKGRMLALDLELTANIGAHTVSYVPLSNGYRVAPTVYDVPIACVRLRGVMTNTVPTAPFRGAGRPEATAVMERLIDIAAQRLKIDRVELRRRNLIRHDKLPHRTATGLTYDSGDFAGNLARALESADWKGFPARRKEAKKRGRLLGIGVANYVETPVGMPHERVAVQVSAAGSVDLIVGTQSSGQGHETSFRQVMADQLGVQPDAINFVSGDSATLASGGGTHSDRSMRLAGSLMVETSRTVIDKARRIAAAMLEVTEGDISFTDGLFMAPNSNRRLTLFDIARAIDDLPSLPDDLRGPLRAEATFTGRIPAYPTGAAVCEAEVDPRDRHDRNPPLHLDRRRRAADQPAHPAWSGARRGRAGHGPGDDGSGGLRAGLGSVAVGQFPRLRHAARRSLPAHGCRADRRSDHGQCVARQGRWRGRHHTEFSGADECRNGCAFRLRHRAPRHAGHAAASLARDPRCAQWSHAAPRGLIAADRGDSCGCLHKPGRRRVAARFMSLPARARSRQRNRWIGQCDWPIGCWPSQRGASLSLRTRPIQNAGRRPA